MQPILFLQSGDTGTIKRISGAEDTRRFLAGLGFVENADSCTHPLQYMKQIGHITDVGNIFNHTAILGQNRSGYDGDDGVFCTADGDLSPQGRAALNDKLLQSVYSLSI